MLKVASLARSGARQVVARRILSIACASALGAIAPAAFGADQFWDSNGTTAGAGAAPAGTWGTDTFWNDVTDGTGATGAWAPGNTAVFAAGTDAVGPYTVTVGSNQSVGGIRVEEGSVTVTGSTVDMPGTPGVDVATGASLLLDSTITGGRLSKTGGGTLQLASAVARANTFSGIDISGGTVVIPGESSTTIGAGNPIGATPATATPAYVNITNGARLRSLMATSGNSFLFNNRGITLGTGGGLLDVATTFANSSQFLLYNGIIAGTGSLTKVGPGQLRLDNVGNSYSGGTIIKEGTIGIGTSSTQLGASTGTVKLDGGGLVWHVARTINNPIEFAQNATLSNTSAAVAGVRNGTLSNNNIIAPAGVTVTVRNFTTAPDAANPPVFNLRFSGSGFNLASNFAIGDAADLGKSWVEGFNAINTTQTFSGVLSGPGIFSRNDAVTNQGGDSILTGANTYSGGTRLNGGFIGVGNNSALGTGVVELGSTGTTDDTAGLFAVGGPRTIANNFTLGNVSKLTIKGTENLTISGTITMLTVTPAITNRTFVTSNTGLTTLTNTISGPAGVGITKDGPGTLLISGVNTYTGGTTVAAGKLVLGNADATASGAIDVKDGAVAQAQAGLPKAVTVSTLNTNTSGKFDLTNNSMVVKGMADSAVRTQLQSGYNAGAWNGATGIVSTSVTPETSIGYATKLQTGITDFKGVTGMADTDVQVKFTYAGDANLDGKVDIGDLGLLAGAWQAASGKVWFDGDFTYDGAVDIGDLGLLSGNWQKGTAGNPNPPLMDFAQAMAQFSAFDGVVVPEPTSLGLLGIAGAGLLARRRRPR